MHVSQTCVYFSDSNRPIQNCHFATVEKNIDVLLRCTTINQYVIDFLRAEDVIDNEQESDLKAQRSQLKQCILLYQWLKEASSDKYESFLQVMEETEQEHVANLLRGMTKGIICNKKLKFR